MSNFLAVATVTATLSRLLQGAVSREVPGATVTTTRPDSAAGAAPATGVNIYMYQATPNGSLRNLDLPTRIEGRLVQRPVAAIDLHYLLTFFGNEVELEPQRLLGSVVRTLHARPALTRQMIEDAVGAVPFLAGSDLADQVELVKFSPSSLSLEELSKLWSVFFQTPYTLSTSYQASVVLVEGDGTPQRALPVRGRGVYGKPFRQPVIEGVTAVGEPDQPLLAGGTLVIRGKRLLGDVTRVRIGEVEVRPGEVADTRITLRLTSPPLPADFLRAGVQGLQVVHAVMLGTPPTPHIGVESNVAPFVLRPLITDVDATNAEVALEVDPPIRKGQRVVLLLNALAGAEPAAYVFEATSPDADTDAITVPISDVTAGDYLVRLQVDGAESPLFVDTDPASPTFDQYAEPRVPIP